eukprot:403336126
MIAFPILSILKVFHLNKEPKLTPLIYIQIENKSIAFTKNDEVAANHFQLYLTALVEKLFYFKFSVHIRKQSIEILDLFSTIVQKKTHLKVQDVLKSRLPQLFGFKYANILFRDPFKLQQNTLCYLKEDMYHASEGNDKDQTNNQKRQYTEQLMRVPCDIGMTGRAVKDMQPVFSEKGSYDNRFRFESDNPMDLTHIHNIIIAPLFLEKDGNMESELMGAIQLFNKSSTDLISEIDNQLLLAVCKILASVVETADELHSTWILIYQLKEQVSKLMKSVENGQYTVVSQEHLLKEANQSLYDASVAVKQLVSSKKTQFIHELVTIKQSEFITSRQQQINSKKSSQKL